MKTISYIAAIFFLFLSLHLPAQTKRALVIGLGVPKGQIAIARDFALVFSHYYGTDSSMVLHKDGTVSSDTFDSVESWEDIIQISVGADVAIGLKSDGTIEMVDDRGTRYDAKKWKNLAYVECKYFGVVGITKKGKILSLFA